MSSKEEEKDIPAFPIQPNDMPFYHSGLTKRELFAVLALQGFISRGYIAPDDAATVATAYADELLKYLAQD